ncbi:developmental protein [Cryptosporidium ryanae]|uniref:developmental protein n=1 Tax=Cryptosporidium ryanae TaxID=515981 RepID=UPI003519E3DD|nr:developmental protein [Cryptosporidium ryanae]
MGNKISIDDSIFELKLRKKELERQYQKKERDLKIERKKAKEALISGRNDLSKIHAENFLSIQEESKELLLMASKLDRMCSKLQKASNKEKISSELLEILPKLQKQLSEQGVMGYNNTNKVKEISKLLTRFESIQPEKIGSDSVGNKEYMHVNENNSVDKLLQELLDEHLVEIDQAMLSRSEQVDNFISELSKNRT